MASFWKGVFQRLSRLVRLVLLRHQVIKLFILVRLGAGIVFLAVLLSILLLPVFWCVDCGYIVLHWLTCLSLYILRTLVDWQAEPFRVWTGDR